jgi:hypothetical protein
LRGRRVSRCGCSRRELQVNFDTSRLSADGRRRTMSGGTHRRAQEMPLALLHDGDPAVKVQVLTEFVLDLLVEVAARRSAAGYPGERRRGQADRLRPGLSQHRATVARRRRWCRCSTGPTTVTRMRTR